MVCVLQGTQDGEKRRSCRAAGCKDRCHGDHDIEYLRLARAYCDCGAAGCSAIAPSLEAARSVAQSLPLRLDKLSRLEGSSESGLDFSFRAWTGQLKQLDTIKAQCQLLVQHTKDTFWLPATAEPRSPLEALAQSVFRFHSSSAKFDPATSGAEWWVQVKDSADAKAPGIDLHYDKDEQVMAE